jgi:hypothetical protein
VYGPTISGTNITASSEIKGDTVSATTSVKSPTISGTSVYGPTISGTNITASAAIRANNVSADTISATTFYGKMSKDLSFSTGTTSVETPYNGSVAKSVKIASDVKHLYRNQLKVDYGSSVSSSNDFTYDPGAGTENTSGNTRLDTITIPTSIDNLSNWNGTCINLPHNVCVTGTITASGAIYSSDKNLKENIVSLKGNKSIFDKVADVDVVSFNFKDDENKNTKYGVIAQDVQKAGLDELVYENNGNLGVDYTSLLMLKIAYLEDTIKNLTEKIEKLENK